MTRKAKQEKAIDRANIKQLLDEAFVITLTETSIILDITKTESNNCFIIH